MVKSDTKIIIYVLLPSSVNNQDTLSSIDVLMIFEKYSSSTDDDFELAMRLSQTLAESSRFRPHVAASPGIIFYISDFFKLKKLFI